MFFFFSTIDGHARHGGKRSVGSEMEGAGFRRSHHQNNFIRLQDVRSARSECVRGGGPKQEKGAITPTCRLFRDPQK